MLGFLKILARNVAQGPSTDPFPFAETHTPRRFRGKVTMDPAKCVGCAICRHVCAGGAIRIEPREDRSGYDFTVWHNTCALCGLCRHYCPTGAITMTNDWHNAHLQERKYDWAEHHFVPYLRCTGCEAHIRMLPPDLATRVYANHAQDLDFPALLRMCPKCRQVAAATRAAALSAQTDADDAAPADAGNGNGSHPAAIAATANEEITPATAHTVKDGGRTDADTPRATAS